ncbi:lysosomal alpha-mannosidase [Pelomyxa schiedti]|nr:lysosomal alpha-mannosidase [Pelomyxa schiedti]
MAWGLYWCLAVLTSCLLASSRSEDVLEVFIVPHSHEDPGWLHTMDEYYTDKVQYILTNMVADLTEHPDHKFTYVEISFFSKWWDEQTEDTKAMLMKLVENGQWEFANGGWVMNDEATTTARDIVNQMQLGHKWLKDNIGVLPKIAWHIDPFGHSNMSPWIFDEMCFDAFVIDRIPYQEKSHFELTQHMEFIWEGSKSFGSQSQMFIWTCPIDLYDTAPFNDYWNFVNETNVAHFSNRLTEIIDVRAKQYTHRHQIFLMGGDFEFTDPAPRFEPFDLMISYINENVATYNMHLQYATASEYFTHISKENIAFPIFGADDFFPYDFLRLPPERGWWSGYFTSWPLYKAQFWNASSSLYRAEVTAAFQNGDASHNQNLRQEQALVQHHDAITGTSKPWVMEDWSTRLMNAENEAMSYFASNMEKAIKIGSMDATLSLENEDDIAILLSKGAVVPIIVSNSLDFELVDVVVSVTVPTGMKIGVIDATTMTTIPSSIDSSTSTLYWNVNVAAIGVSTYFLQTITTASAHESPYPLKRGVGEYYLENSVYRLTFSSQTNRLKSITVLSTGLTTEASTNMLWYDGRLSGAYKFHPEPDTTLPVTTIPQLVSQYQNEHVSQLTLMYSEVIFETWRLYLSNSSLASAIEVEHVIGPNMTGNMELVFHLSSDLASNGTLTTVNNELESITRQYNSSLTAPENYFPMSGPSWISDSTRSICMFSDRAHGVATFGSGTIEVMVARRTLQDDLCGLGMPLEDTSKFATKTWIYFDSPQNTERLRHRGTLLWRDKPQLFVGVSPVVYSPASWTSNFMTSFTMLCGAMPENIHIFSIQKIDNTGGVLRLQHMFEPDADPVYSQPVTIALGDIFKCSEIQPTAFQEITLDGVLTTEECDARHLQWTTSVHNHQKHHLYADYTVTLQPAELRTFWYFL